MQLTPGDELRPTHGRTSALRTTPTRSGSRPGAACVSTELYTATRTQGEEGIDTARQNRVQAIRGKHPMRSTALILVAVALLSACASHEDSARIIDVEGGDDRIQLTIYGGDEVDLMGQAIATGDFNGDGYADVLAGALLADGPNNERRNAGEAFVILGRSGLPESLDLSLGEYDLVVFGDEDGGRLGISVAFGDFNGDGYEDLLAGAPRADGPGRRDAGKAYVVFGSARPEKKVDIGRSEQDFTIIGAEPLELLGAAVGAADFNGDGLDDIVVAAPLADGPEGARLDAGAVYVIFGDPALGDSVDLGRTSPDVALWGGDELDRLGSSLMSGDFNGDGIDDLLIAAFTADGPDNSREDAGEAYVILGSTEPPRTVDLASGRQDLTVVGARSTDILGIALGAGDLNGDGIDDLLIGAGGGDGPDGSRTSGGHVYMILGSRSIGGTRDAGRREHDLVIYGADERDQLSRCNLPTCTTIAVADLDRDGTVDILVGADATSGPGNNRKFHSGEAYVIFGIRPLPVALDLAEDEAGLTVFGAEDGDRLGAAVAIGDIDRDGWLDLVIGASEADGPGNKRRDAGEIYVIYGAPALQDAEPSQD